MYILLGALQYLQVFSSSYISFEVLGKYTIYPVSVLIFSAVLFAVLLIYIKVGVASARALILGIIISNFLLTTLTGITYFQENILGLIDENLARPVFIVDYKYFIVGTIILFFDFILLVILYQFFITKLSKLHYFLILFISLATVLAFDSLVFNIILKFNNPELITSVIGHIIGKSITAFGFSLLLYFYLKFIDKESENISFIADQNRDIFSILKYRKKYLDLKVEKVQAEQKLVSQIESTLNNISDGFVSLDTNWCYTYVNKRAGEFLGKNPDYLIGKHIWTEFPDGVDLPFYKAYYRAVETQQTQYFVEYYEPFGKWFENRIYPSSDGLTIYFTDITEQRKADLALKESENHIRTILETEPECIKQLSAKGELIYMNPAGLAMIEAGSFEQVDGKSVINLITPDHRGAFKKLTADVFNGKSGQLVFEIEGLKGTNRWLETHAVPLRDTRGKIISLLGVTRDITKRRKAEIKLKENEQSLLIAQKIAKTGSYNLDLNTGILEGSSTFKEILGIDIQSELTIDNWKELIYPEDLNINQKVFDECMNSREKYALEFRIVTRKTQELKWIHGLGEITFKNDKAINFFGTIQDITQRKQAEIELELAKDFSESLILNLYEGLSVVNIDGVQIEANPALCKMLGFEKKELVGQKVPFNYWPPEEYDEIQAAFLKATKGEHNKFELTLMRKNGERFPVLISTASVKNNLGEVIANFATIQDISERVKAQKLLESKALLSGQKKDVILKLAGLVGLNYKKAFKEITKEASKTLHVGRVSIWSFNSSNTKILCEGLYDAKTGSYSKGDILREADNPAYFSALYKNRTILITDAQNDDITKEFAKEYLIPNHIVSLMDVFIHSPDGFYGIICFEHVGEINRKWTADEQEFAISIASLVSLMVESYQRKLAENKTRLANSQLTEANKELNTLRTQLEQENIYLRNELDLVFNYEEMVYGSEAFSNILTEVEKVAPTSATVLLLGESGTGKELLARAIHNNSLRNNKPLIKVNCSAIPRELMESELFGHRKGSFTGAFSDKIGKFELADGGTLFLDEIGELPLDMQPKILRFLQEGEIEVVGGMGLKKLDVRVISATNRNLTLEIEKKQFREDLYFRLNVFPIKVPPLRDRKDDIPLLVEHFVDKFNKAYEKNIKYISDDAMNQLIAYEWPGNIRELENLIERALILSNNDTLTIPGFEPSSEKSKYLFHNKDVTLDTVQRNHILQVLEESKWKISGPEGAASMLDLKPSTLRDKMNKLGIVKPSEK
jgi:PAS domain S-box-containing protein